MASLDNISNSTPKRPREEETFIMDEQQQEEAKRHRSYSQILSLLEEEEEDPTQDLTYLITTLQEELFSPNPAMVKDQDTPTKEEEEEREGERVMRHLLEASDDELGIPNREEEEAVVVVGVSGSSSSGSGSSSSSNGGFEEEDVFVYDQVVDDGFGVGALIPDGFWEFEDVGFSSTGFLQPEMFI